MARLERATSAFARLCAIQLRHTPRSSRRLLSRWLCAGARRIELPFAVRQTAVVTIGPRPQIENVSIERGCEVRVIGAPRTPPLVPPTPPTGEGIRHLNPRDLLLNQSFGRDLNPRSLDLQSNVFPLDHRSENKKGPLLGKQRALEKHDK